MRGTTAAVVTLLAMSFSAHASGAGRLRVDAKSHDAGRVPLGESIEHVFELVNDGKSPVRVTDVQASCGCTASEFPDEIAPGASAPLKLTIDTTELDPGPQSKTATVTSDAGEGGRVVLQVKLDVFPPLEILPRPVLFIETRPGHASSRTLLARPHAPDLEIVSAASDNAAIRVTVRPAAAGEAGAREGDLGVEITVLESAPEGLHKATVALETNDPSYPESVIRVSAVVSD